MLCNNNAVNPWLFANAQNLTSVISSCTGFRTQTLGGWGAMRMVVTQASTVMLIFLPHFQMDLLSRLFRWQYP